jgi:hypothetical protein
MPLVIPLYACSPHHPPKFEFYTQAAAKAGLEQPEFVSELKEWKIINSINVDRVLGYQYKIDNWYSWLGGIASKNLNHREHKVFARRSRSFTLCDLCFS